jgi:hypothetical protein
MKTPLEKVLADDEAVFIADIKWLDVGDATSSSQYWMWRVLCCRQICSLAIVHHVCVESRLSNAGLLTSAQMRSVAIYHHAPKRKKTDEEKAFLKN